MGKKKTKREESQEVELFTVEVITRARVNEDAQWEYLVKWAGYDSDADSWEPEENVQGCDRLLKSFWKHVGTDDEDYPIGFELSAKPDWIKDEKAFFASELNQTKAKEKKPEKKKSKKQEKEPVKAKASRESNKTHKRTSSRFQEPSPSSSSSRISRDKRKKGALSITPILISDDSEESDVPLSAPRRTASASMKRRMDLLERDSQSSSQSLPSRRPTGSVERPQKRPKLTIKVSRPATSSNAEVTGDKGKNPLRSPTGSLHSLFSRESSPEIPISQTKAPSVPQDKPVVSSPAVSSPAMASPIVSSPVATLPPSRQGHRNIPKIKIDDLPASAVAGGSTLSTKQRIFQGVLSPSASVPKQPLLRKSSSLAKLTFKKNAMPDPSLRQGEAEQSKALPQSSTNKSYQSEYMPPSSSVAATTESEAWMSVDHNTGGGEFVASPASMASMQNDFPRTFSRDPFLPSQPPLHAAVQPSDAMTEVDQFLAEMMPPVLAARMDDDDTQMDSPVLRSAPLPASVKPAALGKIPKKWKWSGDLFLDTQTGKAERLCGVQLSNATDHLPDGLRFSICFSSVDSIRLGKLHAIGDLKMILPACAAVQQIAKLGPQGDEDTDTVQTLAVYMAAEKVFSYASIVLENITVGILIVFPSTMADLLSHFKVPLDLHNTGAFVAVLLPWRLTSAKYTKLEWQPNDVLPLISESDPLVVVDDKSIHSLRGQPSFHRALQILRFPQWLFDHMRQPNRPFCIWSPSTDGASVEPGLETDALRTIMEQCKARDAGLKADVRVVFIHVGALRTIRKLPALAERRSRRPEIQFITYGTHQTIPPHRWGIHEIFPLGGIVTFTPDAIIEKPLETFELIRQIAEHPLWECYLIPAVLAIVARRVCDKSDPMQLYDKKDPLYYELLELVDEGQISLLEAPPLSRSPLRHKDIALLWTSWQISMLPMDARQLLEECIRLFRSEYANIQDEQLSSVIETRISKDLALMQMQPVLMDGFRRFVVIKGTNEDHIGWDKNGFEWLPVSQFDFKDDFFAK